MVIYIYTGYSVVIHSNNEQDTNLNKQSTQTLNPHSFRFSSHKSPESVYSFLDYDLRTE